MNKYQRGRLGENQAAILLTSLGYKVLERNYRSGRWGELDLICLEGGDLVFIEVKTRSSNAYGQPVEAVSWGKQQRLMRAAQQYKFTHPSTPSSLRFDVIALIIDAQGRIIDTQVYKNIHHG